MNSRERAEIAMRGGVPDRVPVVPLIDTSYAARSYGVPVSECFLDPEAHARALAATLARHPGIDGLSINIGLTRREIAVSRETADGYELTTIDGALWHVPRDDIGTPTARGIARFDDSRLRTVDLLRPHIVETLRALPSGVLREYGITAGLTGPFSDVVFLMGMERVLLAMHEEPEALKQAIEWRVPFALRWAEELAAVGAPSVWIGEGVASNSVISPAQYAEFVLPYERRVTARLRELGLTSALHICGRAARMLESIATSGADCFEADWQVNLADAKARIGGRISLKGNLNTTALLRSSRDAVCEQARAAIAQAEPGGGFLLSSGCAVGRDTPPENIDAMADAVLRAAQLRAPPSQ